VTVKRRFCRSCLTDGIEEEEEEEEEESTM